MDLENKYIKLSDLRTYLMKEGEKEDFPFHWSAGEVWGYKCCLDALINEIEWGNELPVFSNENL